ncbi:MAG: transporter [Pseudomonadales bacterium]
MKRSLNRKPRRTLGRVGVAGLALTCSVGMLPTGASAHDPVFGLGPHTLFKGGVEVHAGASREQDGTNAQSEYALAVKYGITSDWTIGLEAPYLDLSADDGSSRTGRGDLSLSTKYRFWRNDQLGVQESVALMLAAVLDSTAETGLGSGATDFIGGLSYGYEGRRWYRWAALRYRRNGTGDSGVDRGDKVLMDLVGGVRFKPTGYLEPDWVWMLELNGEYARRGNLNGMHLTDTGGSEWFVSPGLMWTLRNVAIKTGVQIPIVSDLNGDQDGSDYRATLEIEVHF